MTFRRFISAASFLLTTLGVIAAIALTGQAAHARTGGIMPLRHFHFKIDDAMPLHGLLPTPPKTVANLPGVLNEDLTLVPELLFGEPIYKAEDAEEKTAHIMAKINRLNADGTDGFLKTLLANRGDLAGMPFLMGKDCRTEEKEAQVFAAAVDTVQVRLRFVLGEQLREQGTADSEEGRADLFWKGFEKAFAEGASKSDKTELVLSAAEAQRSLVAALMQMIAPKSEPYRIGLAKYVGKIQHRDATRALAKLALFAPEETVREAAIDGLKSRKAKDYADVLLQGFRYPLPAVSKRAADALVKLQAKDALADLVNVLEQPDPRAPVKQQIDGKQITFVRELVRVNHHHNCLLCHAPANTADVPRGVLTAPVALPDRALASPFQGYGGRETSPDIFVRIDMTYLRQDFSLMMKVENAKPWPEMQRFDFFVRTRQVTAEEAAAYAKQLGRGTPPNHAAAQFALRELTGQAPADATPLGWRRLLKSAG
jgi:hypothetical protein